MSSDTETSLDVRDLMKRAYVAAPCPVKWEEMSGDAKRRLCDQCNCYVLKAAAMTDEEVLEAVSRAALGQRVCMQFYKRADGTFLTRNCPVGLAALKERARQLATFLAGGLAFVLSSVVGTARAADDNSFIDSDTTCDTAAKPVWHGTVEQDLSRTEVAGNPGASSPALKVVFPIHRSSGYMRFHTYTDAEVAAQKESVQKARQQFGANSHELAKALTKLNQQYTSRDEYDLALQCCLEALHQTFDDWPKIKEYDKLCQTYEDRSR